MLLLITISIQSTVGFITNKSKIMFSFLKEFEQREPRRKHNKMGSFMKCMTHPSHISVLLQTKPSCLEVCRWTHLLRTSWCNSTSKCLLSPSLLWHTVTEMRVACAGNGQWGHQGKHAWLPVQTLPLWNPLPVPLCERCRELFSPSENLPLKPRNYFFKGGKKKSPKWLAFYFLFFFFF